MISVVVTMAGESRRFREAGFQVPMYRVEVHGRSLFAWSVRSLARILDRAGLVVFVGLAADPGLPSFLERECAAAGIARYELISLDERTDGQATTALAAGPALEKTDPLVVYNIDTYVEPASLDPALMRDDGWIPCFPGEGDHWSFVAARPDGRVTEVAEKVRISPHATVGLYGFGSFELFEEAYRRGRPAGEPGRAERYIAPLYNDVVAAGGTVWMSPVPTQSVHPLGTPAEVAAFANGS